jgi:hypothetical protein
MFPTKSQPCLSSLVLSNGTFETEVTKQQPNSISLRTEQEIPPDYLYRLQRGFILGNCT